MQSKIRIAKYIANAGYCSRRDAEKLIEDKLKSKANTINIQKGKNLKIREHLRTK